MTTKWALTIGQLLWFGGYFCLGAVIGHAFGHHEPYLDVLAIAVSLIGLGLLLIGEDS